MKHIISILLLSLLLGGCSTFARQDGLPTMQQLDEWIAKDQYGLALSSLERVRADDPQYAAYVSKHKEVKILAAAYEQHVLAAAQHNIALDRWSEALTTLDTAKKNYPGSERIHSRYNQVLNRQQVRIRKLDAKALLARARLLYNKIPVSQSHADQSVLDLAAHWDVQSMRTELSDMHTRLLAMAQQLLDDMDIELAEMCLEQARILAPDKKSLASIDSLQDVVKRRKRVISEKAAKLAEEKRLKQQLTQRKTRNSRVVKLILETKQALARLELVKARKALTKLGRLAPANPDYLQLKGLHQRKVDRIVIDMISRGNSLYRQEKIAEAREVWREALVLDPANKTLQTQINRASRVLEKLDELRKTQAARQ